MNKREDFFEIEMKGFKVIKKWIRRRLLEKYD